MAAAKSSPASIVKTLLGVGAIAMAAYIATLSGLWLTRVDLNDPAAVKALDAYTSIRLTAAARLCRQSEPGDCRIFDPGDDLEFQSLVLDHAVLRQPYDHQEFWTFDTRPNGVNKAAIARAVKGEGLTYDNVTADDWDHLPVNVSAAVYAKAHRLHKAKLRREALTSTH